MWISVSFSLFTKQTETLFWGFGNEYFSAAFSLLCTFSLVYNCAHRIGLNALQIFFIFQFLLQNLRYSNQNFTDYGCTANLTRIQEIIATENFLQTIFIFISNLSRLLLFLEIVIPLQTTSYSRFIYFETLNFQETL